MPEEVDHTMRAALEGGLKWASFPLLDGIGRVCQTERHDGRGVPAAFMTLIYEEDPEWFMVVHEAFGTCNECRAIMLAEELREEKTSGE